MRLLLLAVWVLLNNMCSFAQKTVTIEGTLEKDINLEQVLVYKPVKGAFNAFFPDTAAAGTIKNGKFLLAVSLSESGFIRLQSKNLPKLYFFAEPGEKIQISYQKNKEGVVVLQFYGKNAGGNNLLANKQLLNNSKTDEEVLRAVLLKSSNLNEVVNGIEAVIHKHTDLVRKSYQDKKISDSFFKILIAETEQKAMSWIDGIMVGYFHKQANIVKEIKLTDDDCRKLVNILITKYDPFNNRYFKTTTAFDNSHTKSELIRLGVIEGGNLTENAWQFYDKDFEQVINNFSVIAYAPKYVQSNFIGNALLIASVFKPMDDITYANALQKYINCYPESVYIPVLSSGFLGSYLAKSEPLVLPKQNGELLSLKAASNTLVANLAEGIDTVTQFQSIIKSYFKGAPVFVDFWASWCSPCLAEFKYEPQLHEFLTTNNIKILYISLDNHGFSDGWKKLLTNYKLDGYHYLANEQVKVNAEKMFQVIPRYMLFDKQGNLVEADLLRPSMGTELYKQIKELLK